ncbi:MAG: 50S ribosomal protein L10 [Tepidisphaeraceae bacterium]|jgi:large subunit ribosomal protein L10
MSKKVKSLIEKELTTKFKPLDGVAVISPKGIDGTKNNQLRRRLGAKGVKVTVVKNTLASRAAVGTKLKGFDKLLDGPSAVVYGKASIATIARMLMEERKLNEKLELRGVFFDGETYPGEKGVEQVSKLPTREEAIAAIVASVLGPGRKLVGAVKGPGGKIAGILRAIEEKAKKAEAAASAAEAAPPAAAPASA